MKTSKVSNEKGSLFDKVFVNLACVLRGDQVSIKAFHRVLQEHAKEMGFRVIFLRISSGKLFITNKPPKKLEEEE